MTSLRYHEYNLLPDEVKSVKAVLHSSSAIAPGRANPDDAGLDLYASKNVSYKPGECVIVETEVSIEIPKGYVGLIRDRSSVSKSRLKVTGGVIDAGYTGRIDIVLLNLSGECGCIEAGKKIAQLLIMPVATPTVEIVSSLDSTARGTKGFGSSG